MRKIQTSHKPHLDYLVKATLTILLALVSCSTYGSGLTTKQTSFFYVFKTTNLLGTGSYRPSKPFFTQVNHLIPANYFSKQATNPSDFSILKI